MCKVRKLVGGSTRNPRRDPEGNRARAPNDVRALVHDNRMYNIRRWEPEGRAHCQYLQWALDTPPRSHHTRIVDVATDQKSFVPSFCSPWPEPKGQAASRRQMVGPIVTLHVCDGCWVAKGTDVSREMWLQTRFLLLPLFPNVHARRG